MLHKEGQSNIPKLICLHGNFLLRKMASDVPGVTTTMAKLELDTQTLLEGLIRLMGPCMEVTLQHNYPLEVFTIVPDIG